VVGVPGTLAAWQRALGAYGSMSLAQVLRPAIRLARRGFAVDELYVGTEDFAERLRAFTPSRALFLTAAGPRRRPGRFGGTHSSRRPTRRSGAREQASSMAAASAKQWSTL